MKLVLTKKPIMEGGEQAADTKAGASVNAEEAELDSFKARCRLVACGNFEGTPGDDLPSQNIDAAALRYMLHVWARNRNGIAGAFDISVAFLNALLEPGHRITMKPPDCWLDWGTSRRQTS